MVVPPAAAIGIVSMLVRAILVLIAAGPATVPAAETSAEDAATKPTKPIARRGCEFIDGTLVPRLVMGVRRVKGPDIGALVVRSGPASDADVVTALPLFRPYYVIARTAGPANDRRVLIQDGYSAAEPLGWVDERHVEPFRSRYAYTYAPQARDHVADLHDTSQASYERLLGQQNGDAEARKELVLIRERVPKNGLASWNPLAIDDLVPFIELRQPNDEIEREYPDTTPTHRFGIRNENRIVHMGAIVGGPKEIPPPDEVSGLEMVFVVDETESMKPFFEGVAAFVENVGKAVAQQNGQVKLAICYYTDGPAGTRVTATRLQAVKGEQDAVRLGKDVRNHKEKLPPGDYAFPPERMLEGLRDSIRKAGFTPGARAFVAVVGDTGHDPADAASKAALVREVADLIREHGVHVFFAHVGRRTTEHDKLFEKDAQAVRESVVGLGLPEDRVVYQPVGVATLAKDLGDAEAQAAARRRERLREIQRIESRTPYTEPGPVLLEQLAAAGITLEQFESRHMQFYVPSRGWLFHPISPQDGHAQRPQFRELFFMAPAEQKAVDALFVHLQAKLAAGTMRIDHDQALRTFATALADAAETPDLAQRVQKHWTGITPSKRSIGVFLEDVLGVRLKAALPYPVEQPTAQRATKEEIQTLGTRIGRLRQQLSPDARSNAFWFEASVLVP
jgi:hypothetical protein